jgi:ribonucleoside-triphosphate reductase
MNPTFLNLDSPMSLPYYEKGILAATMGCRTRIMDNVNGPVTPKGRGNIAPVSMNLVQLGIEANKLYSSNVESTLKHFDVLLDDLLQLSERQLLHRYDTLKKLKGKDLPFIVGEGLIMGAEEVGPDDSIEPILKNGTWGIGFIGLAEALKVMTGKHHGEDPEVWKIGYGIIEKIRKYCDDATERLKLNFTCYATPAEGLSDRFTLIDRAIYGEIPGITDKDFYTNSFHIPVDFNISVVDKIKLEAPFHKLCNAGHISYIELDGPPVDDPDLVERIVRYSFTQTEAGYIGINFGIQYCKDCGTMHVKGSRCPKCESTRLQGVHRVTGYLSLDERFGLGKTAERNARVRHETKM